jgi:hypothetical protein
LKESKRLISDDNNKALIDENNESFVHMSYGTKYSILNLVDLAGSERISESGFS